MRAHISSLLLIVSLTLIVVTSVTPFVPTAFAQTAGAITGAVQDASGAVLPGVIVTARNIDTGLLRSSTTGAEGRYGLPALPPG